MYKYAASLLAVATLVTASPLLVRKDNAIPSDIVDVLAQVADNIADSNYASIVYDAAQNLNEVAGQPGQSAAEEKIMTSLLDVLKTQDPKDAANVAQSVASDIEGGDVPTEAEELASSFVSALRDTKHNTNMADNLNVMISFLENLQSVMPAAVGDGELSGDDEEGDSSATDDKASSKDSGDDEDESKDSETSGAASTTAGVMLLSVAGAMAALF
ncbi:hypothetical protein IWW50_003523 [Coemansia erecta]|nr:hypothetical protein GGF43_002981 [Coemansia sp. RSA 2618]KAJ2824031.1 hypothetical protein IWW50_003523 [Coemansia erecta]